MTDEPTSVPSIPPAPSHTAIYFDGRTNRKHRVKLQLGSGLGIIEDGATIATWPFDAVRRADGPPELLRLSCVAALPLSRLEIADAPMQEAVTARCTALDLGRERHTWRIAGWSLAAVASIVALVFYGIPLAADRLAPLIPRSVEKRLGDAVEKQARVIFGGRTCSTPSGQAAFEKLVEQLKRAGGLDEPLEIQVINSPVPNAFALPGGKVYLLNGLLQKSNNVDEIAGVLAHELGHVRHRDSLRHLIQAGGSSFLIGLLFGDVLGGGAVIFATRTLFNASYSRDAERDADAFAATTMHALGRPAKPMGDLLVRVTGTQANKAFDILASHPLTEERIANLSKADGSPTGADILTPGEWAALKNICGVVAQAPRPPVAHAATPSVRPSSNSVSPRAGRAESKGGEPSIGGPTSIGEEE
jgi:Zn-dependent protease with chaperone function